MIKRTISLLVFVLCLSVTVNSQDTINWRPSYKLKWNDFKATPNSAASFAAQTDCSITYSYAFENNKFSVRVIGYFNKTRSWSKNKTAADTLLLKHEQGHFDINEIFTRKMRQAFSKYNFNQATVNKDLDAIFQKIWKEKLAYDELYDTATDHGKITGKQMEWNKQIAEELSNLDNYK